MMTDTVDRFVAGRTTISSGDSCFNRHNHNRVDASFAYARTRHIWKPGVYFAAVDGEAIVMDLSSDRYFGLSSLSALIWQGLENGLVPEEIAAKLAEEEVVHGYDAVDVVKAQLATWVHAALVVPETLTPPKLPQLKPLRTPASQGTYGAQPLSVRVSVSAHFDLIRAGVWTRWRFRRTGLIETLRSLQQIPIQNLSLAEHERHVCALMNSYLTLRTPFSQGRSDSLMRSLALAAALRWAGVDAEICFGVRKFPFQAHAWVEAGGVAVNENTDVLQHLQMLARF
jgi:hypothetical protein